MDSPASLVDSTDPLTATKLGETIKSQGDSFSPTTILLLLLLGAFLLSSLVYLISTFMPQGNIVETTTLPMISESIEDKNKVVSVAIEDKDIQKMSTKGGLTTEDKNTEYVTRLGGTNMNPYFDTRFFVDEYGTDQAALFGNNPYNDYCKPDEPCMPSLPCEEGEIYPCTKNVPIITSIRATNYVQSGSPIEVTWTGGSYRHSVAYTINIGWTPNKYDEASDFGYDVLITYLDGKIQKLHVDNKVAHYERMIDVSLADISKTVWGSSTGITLPPGQYTFVDADGIMQLPPGQYTVADAEGRWLIALYAKDYTKPISGKFYLIEEREGNKYKHFRMFYGMDVENIDTTKTQIIEMPNHNR